jgi:hypothetical protein
METIRESIHKFITEYKDKLNLDDFNLFLQCHPSRIDDSVKDDIEWGFPRDKEQEEISLGFRAGTIEIDNVEVHILTTPREPEAETPKLYVVPIDKEFEQFMHYKYQTKLPVRERDTNIKLPPICSFGKYEGGIKNE